MRAHCSRLTLLLMGLLAILSTGCGGGGAASTSAGGSFPGVGVGTVGTQVPGKTGVALDVSIKRVSAARHDIRQATAADVQEVLIDFLDRTTLQPIIPTTIVKRTAPSVEVIIDVPVGTWLMRIQGRTASGEVAGSRFEQVITVVEGQTSVVAAELNPVTNLTAIQVTPGPTALLAQGTAGQFTATGIISDLTRQDLTAQVQWSSSNPGVASISPAGLATAVGNGTTTITARSGNVTGSSTLTVTPTGLKTLQLTPNPVELAPGLTQQLVATGVFEDNTNQNVTNLATWTSSAPAVASVSASGLVSAAAPGQATITARVGNVTATSNITVKPTLSRIELVPTSLTLPVGSSQSVRATGVFSDNTTQDISSSVTWSSASSAVATVSASGSVTAVSPGNTSVTARSGNVTATASVRVEPVALVRLAVTPISATVPKGANQAFNATGTFSNNSTRDVTQEVTWTSTNVSVVSISNANGTRGMATAVNAGSSVVEATLDGISAAASVNVSPATLVSLTLFPANPEVVSGGQISFTATGLFSDGSSLVLTTNVTWTSGNVSVVVISNAEGSQGQATSIAPGITSITAAVGNITASTAFTTKASVPPPPLPSPSVVAVTNVLVSHSTAATTTGANGASNVSKTRACSADGRYVAFISSGTDVDVQAPGDQVAGVFVRDTINGTVQRVSLVNNTNAVPTTAPEYYAVAISDDGRRVAFSTDQALVPEDTNYAAAPAPAAHDVYVRDLDTNQTILISRDAVPSATGQAEFPCLSGDGNVVAYEFGTDPVTIYRGTVGAVPAQIYPVTLKSEHLRGPQLSQDGAIMGLYSNVDLEGEGIPSPGNDAIYRYDSAGPTFVRVNKTAGDVPGGPGGTATNPGISSDGSTLAFQCNYALTATSHFNDQIYTWTTPSSYSLISNVTTGWASTVPSISGDGRYVSYISSGDQAPNGWGISSPEGWVRDRTTGNLGRLTYTMQMGAGTISLTLSGNGNAVVFASNGAAAANLLAGLTLPAIPNVYRIVNVLFGGATAPAKPLGVAPTPPP